MNILISNDDGIGTEGIRALVRTMKELGDVYVVAPHTQRSASSHALSVNGQISVKKVDFEGAKMAFECDGTPADCVKLGIDLFKREGIDMDIVYEPGHRYHVLRYCFSSSGGNDGRPSGGGRLCQQPWRHPL